MTTAGELILDPRSEFPHTETNSNNERQQPMTTTTTERFRYVRSVSTEIVYDTEMKHKFGDGYIGDIWHDDDTAALIGRPVWNINNGTTYLWGFATREAATIAMLDVTLAVK